MGIGEMGLHPRGGVFFLQGEEVQREALPLEPGEDMMDSLTVSRPLAPAVFGWAPP